jgi:hypothetical protein
MRALQEEYSRRVFQTDPHWPAGNVIVAGNPLPSRVAVLHPLPLPINLDVELFHDVTVKSADVTKNARRAFSDYLALAPIGGFSFAPGPTNILSLGDIYEALKVEGVRTVEISRVADVVLPLAPAARPDVLMSPTHLAVEGVWNITATPIKGTA